MYSLIPNRQNNISKKGGKCYFKEFKGLREQIPSARSITEMSGISLGSVSSEFQGQFPEGQPQCIAGVRCTATMQRPALGSTHRCFRGMLHLKPAF